MVAVVVAVLVAAVVAVAVDVGVVAAVVDYCPATVGATNLAHISLGLFGHRC